MFDAFHELFPGISSTTNSTCTSFVDGENICLPHLKVPFYFAMRQNLLDNIPDNILAIMAPVVAYWSMSLFFHCLDMSGWTWLDKYRIHESEEVKLRNRATRLQVVWAVIVQHTLQTMLGYYWLSDPPMISPAKCTTELEAVGKTLVRLVRWMVGPDVGNYFLELRGADVTHWLYWWGIPAAQLLFSLCVHSLFFKCVLGSIRCLKDSSSTLGNISFTAGCIRTSSSTNTCIPCTTGSMYPTRSVHFTITLSKDFCSTALVP